MTTKLAIATVALLALGLFAAPTSAQAVTAGITNPLAPTPTNLYFHVLDALQEMPINTQQPDPAFAKDAPVGLATSSTTCLHQAPGDPFSQEYHQYYGYSSPGYVEYNVTQNGVPRTHPERGLSFDVLLDGDTFKLFWYISTQAGTPTGSQLPASADPYVIVPNVAVHAWMRTGEEISIGNANYKSGTLIAEGETVGRLGNAVATSTDSPTGKVTYHAYRDAQNRDIAVYEYELSMKLDTKTIKKESGYNMQVAVFIKDPTGAVCNDPANKIFMPNVSKLHTSVLYRPHMEISIMNPIRIEYMHPQFIGDDMVIHTSSNSPWGNYDVDEVAAAGSNGIKGGIELTIAGASEARSAYRAAVVQRYHEHDHHTEAVDVSFVWPYKTDGAKDGTYTITLKVKNDQGTATAVGVAQFQIGKDLTVTKCGGLENIDAAKSNQNCINEKQDTNGNAITEEAKKSPAFELMGLVASLGAVATLLRRRLA